MSELLRGVRRLWAPALAGAVLSLSAAAAQAQTECQNDIDCPDTACGGQVCSWATTPHRCVPAGTAGQGSDGWCTATSDCKCAAQGATCVGVYCSFTKQGTGGSAAGGSGSGGSGGAAGGSAGAATAGTGGSGTAAKADDGGCSVASAPAGGGAVGLLLAACAAGLGVAFARRRAR